MRLPGQQALGRYEVISVKLVTPRLDINGDEPILVFPTKSGADIPVIDLLPPSREFFGVVVRVVWSHGFLSG
jgi:hypothetical protein